MESILSVIATIISSIALIGVAAGLILQSRQLKASQVQIFREMHLELMRIGIENPAPAASIYTSINAGDFSKAALINLTVNFWKTGYLLKMITSRNLAFQAAGIFQSEYARTWWLSARDAFVAAEETKLDKDFLAILDREFQRAMQGLQTPSASKADLSSEKE